MTADFIELESALRRGDFLTSRSVDQGAFLDNLPFMPSDDLDHWRSSTQHRLSRASSTTRYDVKDTTHTAAQQQPACSLEVGGREEEFEKITSWLNDKRGQKCAVIRGTPGIGKTSLAEACLRHFECKVVRCRGYKSSEQVPYGVLGSALRRNFEAKELLAVISAERAFSIWELLPELAVSNEHIPALTGLHGQQRLISAFARIVEALATEVPQAWLIDDLQWADEASLAAIAQLATDGDSSKIKLLVTVRPDHSRKEVKAFLRDTKPWIIDLAPLADAAVAQLLKRARPEWDLTAREMRLLVKRVAGHPILLQEALSRAKSDALGAPSDSPYFSAEITQLEPEQRNLLEILAVAGVPLAASQLATISGLSEFKVDDLFSRMLGMWRDSGGAILLSHDLLADTVNSSISPFRMRLWASRIGDLLVDCNPTVSARMYNLAGEKRSAYASAIRASVAADKINACSEAQNCLQLALECATDDHEANAAIIRMADVLFRHQKYEDAEPLLQKVIADRALDGSTVLEWQLKHVISLCWSSRFTQERKRALLVEQFQTALAACKIDIAFEVLTTHARLIYAGVLDYSKHEALELEQRFRAVVEKFGPTGALPPEAPYVYANVACNIDRRRGLAVLPDWSYQASGISESALKCAMNVAKVLYLNGEVLTSSAHLRRAREIAHALEAPAYSALASVTHAATLLELGDLDAADQACNQSCFAAHKGFVEHAYINSAWIALARRDYSDCLSRLAGYPATSEYKWPEQVRDGLIGLSYLELGRVRDAFRLADQLEGTLKSASSGMGDVSIPTLLVARAATLQRREREVVSLIDALTQLYENRDYCCWQRLRIAQGQVMIRLSPAEALLQWHAVLESATPRHLQLISEMALQAIRRASRVPLRR